MVYRLTNETSSPLNLSVWRIEGRHEKTGWWEINTRSIWQFETNAAQSPDMMLNASSTLQLEIVSRETPFRTASAVEAMRGSLLVCRVEGPSLAWIKQVARRCGLPRAWVGPAEAKVVDLPQVEFAPTVASPAITATSSPPQTTLTAAQEKVDEPRFPAGFFKFVQLDLQRVLDIYADVAGAQLEIEPQVRKSSSTITLETTQPLTRSALIRLLDNALHEQAGIRVEHLDPNRAKIVYDKALKSAPATH